MRRRNSDKQRATIVEHNVRARRDPRAEPDADGVESAAAAERPRVRSPMPAEPSGVHSRDRRDDRRDDPAKDDRVERDEPEPRRDESGTQATKGTADSSNPPAPPLVVVAPAPPAPAPAPPPAAAPAAAIPDERPSTRAPERASSLPPGRLADRLSQLPPRMDREDLRNTRRQLAEVRARLASAQLDLAKLTEARASDAEVLSKSSREAAAALAAVKEAQEAAQAARAEAEALRGKVRDLAREHHENINLKTALDRVEGERQDLAVRLGEVAAKLDRELASKKDLEERVVALKYDVALLKSEEQEGEKAKAQRTELEGKVRTLADEIDHLKKALEQEFVDKRSVAKELDDARGALEAEKGAVALLRSELEAERRALAEAREKAEAEHKTVGELRGELEAERRSLAERDMALLDAEEKIEGARTAERRATERADTAEKERAALSTSCDDLARSLSATETERDAVRKRLDLLHARLLEVRRSVGDVDHATRELARAQESARASVDALVDTATRGHTQLPPPSSDSEG
ncbi:MAG: hypothetical protein JNL38_02550 [Myxococcales bacterium]|nr:hypothetical protein [Myxococcales bacterium]